MTPEELKTKYPSSNHAPRQGCKYCKGSGEKTTQLSGGRSHVGPCICLYVDHDMADFAAESLATTAKKLLAEMDL